MSTNRKEIYTLFIALAASLPARAAAQSRHHHAAPPPPAPVAAAAPAPAPAAAPVAAPPPAAAPVEAPDPARAEARTHYVQGVAFFRAQQYNAAIAEFEQAYAAWANPTILFSMAQSHERLLHVREAIAHYEHFLRDAPATAPQRADAEEALRGLQTLLAEVRVQTNTPAVVRVGERSFDVPGVVELVTGSHELEVSAEGYVTQRRALTVVGGRRDYRLSLELARVTQRGLAPAVFWTALGVSCVTAAGAVSVGVAALALSSSFNAREPIDRTLEERQQGQRVATAADVMLGATALLGATTALLYVNTNWARRAERAPRVTYTIDPILRGGTVGVTANF